MKCPKCKGTGKVVTDRSIGSSFRRQREAIPVSLREFAREMGISAAYLSDLERGKRVWRQPMEHHYARTLGKF